MVEFARIPSILRWILWINASNVLEWLGNRGCGRLTKPRRLVVLISRNGLMSVGHFRTVANALRPIIRLHESYKR